MFSFKEQCLTEPPTMLNQYSSTPFTLNTTGFWCIRAASCRWWVLLYAYKKRCQHCY